MKSSAKRFLFVVSFYRLFLISVLTILSLAASPRRLVLSGGMVLDGSGKAPFPAGIAVAEGQIVDVGFVEASKDDEVLVIQGLIVAPGFIDIHSHSEEGLLEDPSAVTQVSQGITTVALGADGDSPFPLESYLGRLSNSGIALNVAMFVGHGTVRQIILGDNYKRKASEAEIEAMSALVKLAMQQGAFGLSSGLEYDPGFYSSTSELTALARVASESGGIYMSHIRDEEEGFRSAISEAIEIGRLARIPVQISHLKLGNTRVWGRSDEVLDLLHDAAAEGIDIAADCYPYNAWASGLSVLVPSRRFEDRDTIRDSLAKVGGPEKILVTGYPPEPPLEFQTLERIARRKNQDAIDVFQEMLRKGGADVVCESMSDEDVTAFYQDPLVLVASDGGTDSQHPRMAGTFPRVLREFVREKQVLRLEEAVRKMTSAPAGRLKLADRGLIRTGMRADLVIFDPKEVRDRATFQEPSKLASGILFTIVNGEIVWREGKPTGALPGQVLYSRSRTN